MLLSDNNNNNNNRNNDQIDQKSGTYEGWFFSIR